MDVVQAIEILVPEAQYTGALNDETEAQYKALNWMDSRDKPPWPEVVALGDVIALDLAKKNKHEEIDYFYYEDSNAPVEVNGIVWSGGYISGIKLDAKKRLNLELNINTVSIHDVNYVEHVLQYDEASEIIHAVAERYSTLFNKRAQLIVQINEATTIEEVEALTWS